jgi:hypothetical protein
MECGFITEDMFDFYLKILKEDWSKICIELLCLLQLHDAILGTYI